MGQEVRPLYAASVFRVQGCKLAGCLFLFLIAQGPVAIPSLCCLVAVAHEVVQGQGAICGRHPCWLCPPFLSPGHLHSPLRHLQCPHSPGSRRVIPPIGRRAQGSCGGRQCHNPGTHSSLLPKSPNSQEERGCGWPLLGSTSQAYQG